MTEFDLSEKRWVVNDVVMYHEEDVKKSIKNIKEELCQRPIKNKPCDICINCKTINYEVGDKLK